MFYDSLRFLVIVLFVTHSLFLFFFFSSRRRHTMCLSDWSSDVCSSDLPGAPDPSGWLRVLPARRVLCGAQYRARAGGSLHSRKRSTERNLLQPAIRRGDTGTDRKSVV